MVETTQNKQTFIVGGNPVFAFNLPFYRQSDLKVYVYDDVSKLLILNSNYTIEEKSDYSTGAEITLLGELPEPGSKLVVIRQLPLTQDTSLPEYGKLPSKGLESQLDKIIYICQQLSEVCTRAVTIPPGAPLSPGELLSAMEKILKAAEDARQVCLDAKSSCSADAQTAAEAAALSKELLGDLTVIKNTLDNINGE